MALATEPVGLLNLPPEIRNQIYELTIPCCSDRDAYCNPILSRRLASQGGFFCYRCPGETLLQVCRQSRKDVLPILLGAHELRFQLWKHYQAPLAAWLDTVSDEAITSVRRFRLYTQYLGGASLDATSAPSAMPEHIYNTMPGNIAVNLDAQEAEGLVIVSNTWTKSLLAEPSRDILEIAQSLSPTDGRKVLDKDRLLQMIGAVGWFGMRNAKEHQMFMESSQARATLPDI